jgi:hypothetical protein
MFFKQVNMLETIPGTTVEIFGACRDRDQKKKMNIRASGLQDFIFSSEFLLMILWLGKRNRKCNWHF